MRKTINLSRATATRLMKQNVCQGLKPIRAGQKEIAIYTAFTGCLEIRCENDWYNHNGCIKLTIYDGIGANVIHMYFNPITLERDFGAEEAEKQCIENEKMRIWAQNVGREAAHQLVDEYLESDSE